MVSVINVLASYVACLSFILLTFHFAKRQQISKVDLVAHLKSINPGKDDVEKLLKEIDNELEKTKPKHCHR